MGRKKNDKAANIRENKTEKASRSKLIMSSLIAIVAIIMSWLLVRPSRRETPGVLYTSPSGILRQASLKRMQLRPGELHIVDDFLGSEEVMYLRNVLDAMGPWDPKEPLNQLSQYLVNGAYMKECTLLCEEVTKHKGLEKACPECPIPPGPLPAIPESWKELLPNATVANDHVVGRILRRTLQYANGFIDIVNSTLHGESAYNGTVFFDHGNLRRNVVFDTSHTAVDIHIDSDSPRRCLSAAITLTNSAAGEGAFRTYACPFGKERECNGLQGDHPSSRGKLAYKGVLARENWDQLRLLTEVPTALARAVFFLAETPHSVTPLENTRDVYFVWMACSKFAQWQGEMQGSNAVKLQEYLKGRPR